MPALPRLLLLLLLVLGSATLRAQDSTPPDATPAPTPAQTLDQLGKQLDGIKVALKDNKAGTPLAELRQTALAVQDQSRQLGSSLAPQMTALQSQLAVLGAAPAKGAAPEAPEMAAQRRKLEKAQADLDAQIKQAQLLNQSAVQLAAQITGLRNDEFQARLATRTTTPLGRAFWADLARTLPDDLARQQWLAARFAGDLAEAWQPPNWRPLLGCLLAALLLLGGGRFVLERLLLALATRYVPDGRLRRSAMATAVSLSAILTTGLAAQLAYLGVNWNGTLDDDLKALATGAVGLVCFAAYVTGLGRALLSVRRPSWRLPALSDRAARRLRPFPWLLAAAALLFGMIEHVIRAVGTSLPATVATRGLFALVISGLIGAALLRLHRSRRELAAEGATEHRPVWAGLLVAAVTLGVTVSWLGVASGFIALAFFVAVQMLWVGVIVATVYLLIHLLTDLIDALLSPHGRGGQRLQASFALAPHTLEQAAILLAGICRVGLVLLAMATVLTPFGAGPGDLLASAEQTLGNLKLGELAINPGSIFGGVLVLLVGLAVLRTLKRWLREKLLPASGMERGMQESIVTLLGYLGVLLVAVLTLAALHVDLKSITWIVSALSVGIGFGLQAIVQNFISGLILLVERPVKVGDWISLSSELEGDVRRINVRATEIQLWDRSTMIVPNSQLITQNVRNVTHADALGRVQIKLPMPLDTDAAKVRELVLGILRAHAATLDAPAPYVQLENLNAGVMSFNCVAYVGSPREVSGVKSELLFEILQRLRSARLPMTSPQSMLVRTLPPLADDIERQG